MTFFLRAFVSLLVFAVLPAVAGKPLSVIHPGQPSLNDPRYEYQIKLLKLALDKSGIAYQMQPSKVKMEQGRALLQLERGRDIDVTWSMTSREREQKLLPIRIPIDKGLIGYRVFLVKHENLKKFSRIRTLDQLRRFEAGQGSHWPDTTILRENGLGVYGATTHETLFNMLEADRFDYFPRSVTEAWNDLKAHPGHNFVVEPTLMLVYPAALYYFVNKQNTKLAQAIESGLRLAIQDGSFEKLFQAHFGEFIRKADLGHRRVIRLKNLLLPEETPLMQRHLWFRPLD